MDIRNGTQDQPVMAGANETPDDTDQPDTRHSDPAALPDGSGSDKDNAADGEDTASGGGADDE